MKTCTSQAIIMRVRELGESDLLVTFLTPERGRLKGVAKGARRSRKRFINCLDIFSLVNLEYLSTRRGGLYLINSGKLMESFPGLRRNFSLLSRASYMVELAEILFPWELPDRNIFEVLKKGLHLLSQGERIDLIPILYEVLAMSLGGYGIDLEKCCVCGRRYESAGTAVFKPEKGGIACMRCQQVTAATPGMSPDAVNIIGLIQSRSTSAFEETDASDEAIMEIRSVLKLHREYHLGQRVRTANYL